MSSSAIYQQCQLLTLEILTNLFKVSTLPHLNVSSGLASM